MKNNKSATIYSIQNVKSVAVIISQLYKIPEQDELVGFIQIIRNSNKLMSMDVADKYIEIAGHSDQHPPMVIIDEFDPDSMGDNNSTYNEIEIIFNKSNRSVEVSTLNGIVDLPAGRTIVLTHGSIMSSEFHRMIHVERKQEVASIPAISIDSINIVRHDDGNRFVDARELWTFLGSKQDFSTWIKNRITKYDFDENVDYFTLHKKMGRQILKEYQLTMDVAKELSMVENTDKGREARKYFIKVEKDYIASTNKNRLNSVVEKFNLPTDYLGALKLLVSTTEDYEKASVKIKENAPKVKHYDEVLDSRDLFTISQIGLDLNTTAIALNRFLRDEKIIYKKGLNWMLYRKHMQSGLAGVGTYIYDSESTDIKHTRMQLKWTQTGREFIINLWNSKKKES